MAVAGPYSRLSLVAFLVVAIFALSEAGHRKKKHHHRHHHKHRRHKAHGANGTNATASNATASNRSAAATNMSNGTAQRRGGLLDMSNPKASHGAAAVHAAVHSALHRAMHAGRLTAHGVHMPEVPRPLPATTAEEESQAAKNLSLLNRSQRTKGAIVALARLNASAAQNATHPSAHHHRRHHKDAPDASLKAAATTTPQAAAPAAPQEQAESRRGELLVGGPLPPDFEERFAQGVSQAAHVPADAVRVLSVKPEESAQGTDVDTVVFSAPGGATQLVEDEAGDPESELANGLLHVFLVDRSAQASGGQQAQAAEGEQTQAAESDAEAQGGQMSEAEAETGAERQESGEEESSSAAGESGNPFDVDSEMPFGDLEPFGREDTAEELTGSSIRESDQMVDQLERAEVAEEKRAVFRALTRLRGAAITSFDGIARSQTGNIDQYNKHHRWRDTHPLHHLAEEESDVAKWAFPDSEPC